MQPGFLVWLSSILTNLFSQISLCTPLRSKKGYHGVFPGYRTTGYLLNYVTDTDFCQVPNAKIASEYKEISDLF
jgi:hypothetical protein